jgi:hypothetical protein
MMLKRKSAAARGSQRYHRRIATNHDDRAAARREAIERTRGMFAHLTSGRSLVDELIADRRAEARAEDLQEAEDRRRRGES